jgi:putative peptidoglycan lipid II flippase
MAGIRALLARFLPQGAILLSILTFTAYAMGLVRDRLFARTYGAGTELDAYNAAFVLPELALDVLVASGLTAPFVPVFTSLARQAADAAPRFAQTVLTLAVMVMSASSLLLLILAPATVRLVAPGFDESSQALYLDLYRLMLLTPIIFGASITLGEVLVAERQFLYYALAPILYNLGIAGGTLLLHDRLGIMAAAVGAVIGACLHLGIRVVGMRHTTVRIRPRLDLRMPALREFLGLMLPKMISHPIEPLTFLFFTAVATTLVAGSVSAVSFARRSRACQRPGLPAIAAGSAARCAGTRSRSACSPCSRRSCSSSWDRSPSRCCWEAAASTPRMSGSQQRCSPCSHSRSRSTLWATSSRVACMPPTTRSCRSWRPSPGSA